MANQNLSTYKVIIYLLSLHIVWIVCIMDVKLPSRRLVKVIKASLRLRSHSLCDMTFLWLLSSTHYEERQMLILSLSESFSGIRFYSKVLFFLSLSKLVATESGGGEETITVRDLEQCFLWLILGVLVSFEEGGYFLNLVWGSLCWDFSALEQCR